MGVVEVKRMRRAHVGQAIRGIPYHQESTMNRIAIFAAVPAIFALSSSLFV